MPPEENHAGSPEDWLRHARSDLVLSRITPPPMVLLESLCFHAQQAAEKALKAVLVSYSIPLPKTHSIRMLLDLLSQNLSVSKEVEESATLTDYAVISRYPGDLESVEYEEYQEAITLAEKVVSWAETAIHKSPKT